MGCVVSELNTIYADEGNKGQNGPQAQAYGGQPKTYQTQPVQQQQQQQPSPAVIYAPTPQPQPPPPPEPGRGAGAPQVVPAEEEGEPGVKCNAHNHPLKKFATRYQGRWQCNICLANRQPNTRGQGVAYACDECGFDAHPACFYAQGGGTNGQPLQSKDANFIIPDHAHKLELYESRYASGKFNCNVCKEKHIEGQAYSCHSCSFDACPDCFNKSGGRDPTPKPREYSSFILPDQVVPSAGAPAATTAPAVTTPAVKAYQPEPESNKPYRASEWTGMRAPPPRVEHVVVQPNFKIPQHDHPLEYFQSRYANGSFTCNVCKESGGSQVYACHACSFDCHPSCFKKSGGVDPNPTPKHNPFQSNFTVSGHEHVVTLYTSRYKNGAYKCDVCGGDGEGKTYSCAACGWDIHPECFEKRGGIDIEKVAKPNPAHAPAPTPAPLFNPVFKVDAERAQNAAAGATATATSSANAPTKQGKSGNNIVPAWPSTNDTLPFPEKPYAFTLGLHAEGYVKNAAGGSTALNGGNFNAFAAHMKPLGTPQSFFPKFHRAVFIDLRKIQDWTVGKFIDQSMNAIIWSAIFQTAAKNSEASWKELEDQGILCCELANIPKRNSIFVTHRWSSSGGLSACSPSFFQAYTLYNCKIKGSDPCWTWIDLLCVPQIVPWKECNPMNFNHSDEETRLRHDSNAEYMSFIGLQFGFVATACEIFFHHQPLCTIYDVVAPGGLSGGGGTYKYDSQRAYFTGWGMKPDFLQFPDHAAATKAGMSLIDSIRLYTSSSRLNWNYIFYSDLSYVNRIWCLAEFAVRMLGRGSERFEDIGQFFHELWELHGPQDLKQRTNGHAISNKGGAYNMLLRDMQLGSQRELKDTFVLESLEGCVGKYIGVKKLTREKMLTSIFTLEGLISVVANAAATVQRDIPLVIKTLFTQLCQLYFDAPEVPAPITNMLEWCYTVGLTAPKFADPLGADKAAWIELQTKFWKLVDPASPLLREYLAYVGPTMKMGANSLFTLDRILSTLLVNGYPLKYDPIACNKIPSAASPAPVPSSIPAGYEFAPTAVWFLQDQLHLNVTDYFTDGDNGTNLPFMSDYGSHLIEGEKNRLYINRGWHAPKPQFPGYPQSEFLFPTEESPSSDPLACFQPLQLKFCPFRPVYGIKSRQSDVLMGDNFRASESGLSKFLTEHVVVQLNGTVVGRPLTDIRVWQKILQDQSYPNATKAPGTRRISSKPCQFYWWGGEIDPKRRTDNELH